MANIRKAVLSDLPAITEIYNEAIENGTATFDTEVKSLENRKDWFLKRDENFPILVAEENKKVIAFAALNKWSEREAYSITAEVSFYVHVDFRNKGIGKKIFFELCKIASESTNLHSLISRISQGNEASIHLHMLQHFRTIGTMQEAGRKFGKLHDVTFLQKMLR